MGEITLKDQCCIVGVGHTEFTKGTEKTVLAMHVESCLKAIEDAGLRVEDIDAVVPYSVSSNLTCNEQLMHHMGLRNVGYSFTKHQGGASMVASIQDAVMAITCGLANNVLFVGGRKGFSDQRISDMAAKKVALPPLPQLQWVMEFELPLGNVGVGTWYGAGARRHMHEYGTTSRQFGAIAVACRKHAELNPNAVMQKPMTIEDHQSSKMVIDPFRLFDFSIEADAAAAFVISSSKRARDLRQPPVYIMGVGEGHPDVPTCSTEKKCMTEMQGFKDAAKRAFAIAGVAPKDVDAVQIHDGMTYPVLCALEDAGFCKKGEGGPFVEEGRIELGGELPLNTSGGALSEAHVGGLNHIIEGVRQLRGQCAERQVENAEIVFVGAYGDFGDGGVAILRR